MVPSEYLKSKDVEFEISGKMDGSIYLIVVQKFFFSWQSLIPASKFLVTIQTIFLRLLNISLFLKRKFDIVIAHYCLPAAEP